MIATPKCTFAPRFLSFAVVVAALAVASPASSDQPSARVPRGAMAIRAREPSTVTRAPTSPLGPTGRLVYHGGRVISNVKVYQVLWGPNVWSRVAHEMAGFYTAVTNSEYLDWLGSQYDTVGRKSSIDGMTSSNQHIGRGTFGGTITITPSDRSTTLTTDQIAAELAHQIGTGALPPPDVDANGNVNALYMFDFPPGMTLYLDNSQGCVTWYAYHYTTTIAGKSVPYGVHPDFSQDCASGNFTLMTSVHSHELIEAITDMEVGLGGDTQIAWNSDQDGGQEIGDLCNSDVVIAGYTVQKMWSNHDGACMGTSAFRLPICSGTLTAPSCRPCTAIDDGVACNGGTPVCETDHSSIKVGQCVHCTADTGCSGATPVCDKSTTTNADTCRACAGNADCKGATPVCATGASDPKKGECVACASNADCKDPGKPVCTDHACVVAPPAPSDGGARPPVGDGGVPLPGADGGANDDNGPPVEVPPSDSSCACTMVGPSPSATTGLGTLLFAIASAARRRRRR